MAKIKEGNTLCCNAEVSITYYGFGGGFASFCSKCGKESPETKKLSNVKTVKYFLIKENIIMWAFRYALGRRTGAVQDVIECLDKNWKSLEQFTRDQIKIEIKIAIDKDQAGDKCDVDNWKRVLEDFE